MSTLIAHDFVCHFQIDNAAYVVVTLAEPDGGLSLLLYPGSAEIDPADTPPLMLLSDSAGDRLSTRIERARQDTLGLAKELLHELSADLNDDLQLETVDSLVESLAKWIEANHALKNVQ